MSNYLDKSIKELNKLLKDKKIKPIDLVNEAFERIESNSDLNCFITLNKEEAVKKAIELENKELITLQDMIKVWNFVNQNLRKLGFVEKLTNEKQKAIRFIDGRPIELSYMN